MGLGFLLVMLIVAAGGIFAKMIEREQVERRRLMREAQSSAASESETDRSPDSTQDVAEEAAEVPKSDSPSPAEPLSGDPRS